MCISATVKWGHGWTAKNKMPQSDVGHIPLQYQAKKGMFSTQWWIGSLNLLQLVLILVGIVVQSSVPAWMYGYIWGLSRDRLSDRIRTTLRWPMNWEMVPWLDQMWRERRKVYLSYVLSIVYLYFSHHHGPLLRDEDRILSKCDNLVHWSPFSSSNW